MICQITRAGQYSLAWEEVSGKKHISAYGTKQTCSASVRKSEIPSKADLRACLKKTGNIEEA
jgi:hypothetical protein